MFVGQGKARQGKARQGKARQGKARQGKARQGKARQADRMDMFIVSYLRRPIGAQEPPLGPSGTARKTRKGKGRRRR